MWSLIRPTTLLAKRVVSAGASARMVNNQFAIAIAVLTSRPLVTAAATKSVSRVKGAAAAATAGKTVKRPTASAGKPKPKSKSKSTSKSKSAKSATKKPKAAKAAKAKTAKPVKKPISLAKKATLAAAAKKELVAKCLFTLPKRLPATTQTVFISRQTKGVHEKSLAAASASYKDLTAEEVQELKKIANNNKATNQAAYKTWLLSHTPAQIIEANRARKRFVHLHPKVKSCNGNMVNRRIVDERIPSRPVNAFGHFLKTKLAASDSMKEALKTTASEWHALSEPDRQVYRDMYQAGRVEYLKACKEAGLEVVEEQ